MTLKELCEQIALPGEVTKTVIFQADRIKEKPLTELLQGLTEADNYRQAQKELTEALGEDEGGMKQLACMLLAALLSYEKYKEKGISREVFTDTMKCFTRFVKEHQESYGVYGFDRGFWTGRQLSMLLFRIGELEYEFLEDTTLYGKKVIDIHIPSDARLTAEACLESAEKAGKFLKTYFAEKADLPFMCCSWLLSPALESLLPKEANINRFRGLFVLEEWQKEEEDFMQWVYKRTDYCLEELPEETSLQKKMKEYLLAGGKVGTAKGKLQI